MFGLSEVTTQILGYVLIGIGAVVLISLLVYTLKSKIFSDSKYVTLSSTSKKPTEEIEDDKKAKNPKTTAEMNIADEWF